MEARTIGSALLFAFHCHGLRVSARTLIAVIYLSEDERCDSVSPCFLPTLVLNDTPEFLWLLICNVSLQRLLRALLDGYL